MWLRRHQDRYRRTVLLLEQSCCLIKQRFAPPQQSAQYVFPGCKQLRLMSAGFDQAILTSVATTRKQKCESGKFIPYKPWEMAIRGQKITCCGRLCWIEVKVRYFSTRLVATDVYSHHHYPLVCSVARRTNLNFVTCGV